MSASNNKATLDLSQIVFDQGENSFSRLDDEYRHIDQPRLRYWRCVEKEFRSCGGPTEQVDDAFIIGSEEPDGVFKEEHEGCIDDSVRQLVGIDLERCRQHTHTDTH